MNAKFQARLPYLILVVLTLTLDRWTKWLIDTGLILNQTKSIIDGFFNITYVRNTGVAFGIFDPVRSPMKSVVLAGLGFAAAAGVAVYSWKTPSKQKLLQGALSLILAGALGNLYDRVRYGYVIDFIELYFHDFRWPSFNIADSAITTGVVLLALEMFRKDNHDVPSRA